MPTSSSSSLAVIALSGVAFGFALEKGRVFEPEVVINQMRFTTFIMLKMFLSALVVSKLSMVVLSVVSPERFEAARAPWSDVGRPYHVIALGSALSGAAFYISGACAGTVLPQLGAFVSSSAWTFGGALCGALVYSLAPYQDKPTPGMKRQSSRGTLHDDILGGSSYQRTALVSAGLFAAVVLLLELAVPWQTDLPTSASRTKAQAGAGVLAMYAWPPEVAGAIIGAMQFPVILLVGKTLGSSASYCVVTSNMMSQFANDTVKGSSYMSFFKDTANYGWQVVYVAGAIVGGYLSASMSQSLGAAASIGSLRSFCGGFLMLYGARLAAGCTSGHGISGFSLLNTSSFVSVAAMFGTGIACALIFG